MTSTRRTLLLSGLAAPLGRPALAQSRPVLRVQCMGGAVEKTIREAVVPGFERDHRIDVQLIVEDDVTILPKLQVARSRAPYDVCLMDNDKAILGEEAGLWAPDQSDNLKSADEIYSSCKPPARQPCGRSSTHCAAKNAWQWGGSFRCSLPEPKSCLRRRCHPSSWRRRSWPNAMGSRCNGRLIRLLSPRVR